MAHRLLLFIALLFHFSLSPADDAVVMSKLSTSIFPTPSTWNNNSYCDWEGITCDNSNRVTSISLSSKSLFGTLPSDLNNLSQLKTLSLRRNLLSCDLPSLANLTLLEKVLLDSNNFSSVPSGFFSGLINLQTLSISDNPNLSPWSLSNDLILSPSLRSFQASYANIIGSIPDIFDYFPNLENLRLSYNNLNGALPASFGRSKIVNLWLNNQNQGPSSTLDVISSMTQLSQVWLQANSFTGAIPDLSKCIHIFDMQLRDNQLPGLVPSSLMSLPKLANITLGNNKLQGPLLAFQSSVVATLGSNNSFYLAMPGNCDPQVTTLLKVVGALRYPMSLALSREGNNVCASWPFITCDSSEENVTVINFSKQKFSGTISPSFRNLTSLRWLSLSDNNLTGSIPEILASLPNLQLLDVSNNNLSGPIPKFPQHVKFLYENNLLLGQKIPGGSPFRHPKGSLVSTAMVIGVVMISVFVFAGIVSYARYYKCYGAPTKLHSTDHNEMPVSENGNLMISIQVLDQVTNNFSDNNVLGRGGFGIVYKGELHDGTLVAVKRMKSDAIKGMKEFRAEIEVLTKVRHQHFVVKIVGNFCIVENMFKDKSMQFRFIEHTSESREAISKELEDDSDHIRSKENYLNNYFEYASAEAEDIINNVDDVVNNIYIDSLEKCIEFLDIIHDMEFPWAHRNILKGPFIQMVSWFLKQFLGITNRPIPPRFENGKYVELYDLYIMVQREGGHKRVSMYNIWVVIAKELGFDYEDKDMMRILYAQYLDVLDWQYIVHKNARKTAENMLKERHESSQVRRVNTTPNMSMNAQSSSKEMKPNEEDYALYMGGDWRAAKRYMKRRNFDFTQAEIALKEAIETLPTSLRSPSYI